jgi:hypothetical protein
MNLLEAWIQCRMHEVWLANVNATGMSDDLGKQASENPHVTYAAHAYIPRPHE